MYDVFYVAAYAINRAIEVGSPISNLSLQKILYYIQAAFLVEKNEVAFSEPILAWKYGPVVESVYHEYKIHSNSCIDRKIVSRQYFDFDSEDYFIVQKIDLDNEIESADMMIFNKIIDSKCKINPLKLVQLTHEEQPWKEANLNGNTIIDIDSIRNYFERHKDKLWT